MPKITVVTPENVLEEGLFCIKTIDNPGFQKKEAWYRRRFKEGLRMKIVKNDEGKPAAFIEYVPAEYAWRPVDAPGYMFIHCMMTAAVKDRKQGYGTALIGECESDARLRGMKGMAVFTSSKSWLAEKSIFEKNGFEQLDKNGRFELLAKSWGDTGSKPAFLDWERNAGQYTGWHLFYADQCPWHEKSVRALRETASKKGIELTIHLVESAAEAKEVPSGFGVFALIRDGRLLADHYISNTRFLNILRKELG